MTDNMKSKIGLRILESPERPDPLLLKRFEGIPSSNIGDIMNRLYCMDSSVRPFGRPSLIGPAFTVKVPEGDNLFIHRALDLAQPGDILVVDGGGSMCRALMGEIMFTYASQKRLAGIVINGCIRDQDSLEVLNLPVYAAGVTPQGPYKHGPGEINVPVSCGGQAVLPGDILVGDNDGICVIRREDTPQIIDDALRKMAAEKKVLKNYRSSQIAFEDHKKEYEEKTELCFRQHPC